MANMANMIATIMQSIMDDMDFDSQYMDFLDDFELIESHVESIAKDNPVHAAWLSLYAAIYAAKGDLDSVREEMEELIRVAQ